MHCTCLLLTQSGHAGYRWRTWAANPEGITGEELLDFVNGDLFLALKNLAVSTKPGDRRRVVTNAARKKAHLRSARAAADEMFL